MKHIIYILIIIVSVTATYFCTFKMAFDSANTSLVRSVMFDHKTRVALIGIIENNEMDKTIEFISMLATKDLNHLESLLNTLERSNWYPYIDDELTKGREYLNEQRK